MNIFDEIRRVLGGKPALAVKCGGLGCPNYVEVGDGPQPDIHICKNCQNRMNEGIVQYLHAHTGKTRGGFHATDGYTA